jgi:hypothetical protein
MIRTLGFMTLVSLSTGCVDRPDQETALSSDTIRVATFNIWELSTAKLMAIDSLGIGHDSQAMAAATIIQQLRPDILLLNEIDHDYSHPEDLALNLRRFQDHYLSQGPDSIRFGYWFAAPSNTGLLSGHDLDGNGVVATDRDRGTRTHGDDSFGFGLYPGQYAMALMSRFPIDTATVRSFQKFLWRDFPNHHLPPDHFSAPVLNILRLSSKSHWDIPIVIGSQRIHVLASHPTPPVFDGPEDRNGRRNFDEVGFWLRYLDNSQSLVDDRGMAGGLATPDALFIIAGDLNASPENAESVYEGTSAIGQLLSDSRIADHSQLIGKPTATFLGGTRVDFLLTRLGMSVVDGGVFSPDSVSDAAGAALARRASDHRMVWLDIVVP